VADELEAIRQLKARNRRFPDAKDADAAPGPDHSADDR
jgi:hypothetical protein